MFRGHSTCNKVSKSMKTKLKIQGCVWFSKIDEPGKAVFFECGWQAVHEVKQAMCVKSHKRANATTRVSIELDSRRSAKRNHSKWWVQVPGFLVQPFYQKFPAQRQENELRITKTKVRKREPLPSARFLLT